MKKPIGILWLSRLNVIRLIILTLLIINAIIILNLDLRIKLLRGLAAIILHPLGNQNPFNDVEKSIFLMIGYYWIPWLMFFLEYVFIETKSKIAFWICLFIDVSFMTFAFKLSLVSVIILALALPNSSRKYFLKNQNEDNRNLMDIENSSDELNNSQIVN
jgi:hypothetical protein